MAIRTYSKERVITGVRLRSGRWSPSTMLGDDCASLLIDLLRPIGNRLADKNVKRVVLTLKIRFETEKPKARS
jgi:hypothetical protein